MALRLLLWGIFCGFTLLLNGALFSPPAVELDPNAAPVYEQTDAGLLLNAFEKDQKSAKERYGGQYLALVGKVIASSGKELTIGGLKGTSEETVSCKASDEELYNVLAALRPGDGVQVCGKLNVSILNGALGISPDSIEKTNMTTVPEGIYLTAAGDVLDESKAELRELLSGAVSYKIPKSWKAVEHDLKAEGLGTLEGFQYRLNEEAGRKAAYAESFFITALHKDELVDINDRGEDRLIEKAVAADILGREELKKAYPLRTIRTAYGQTCRYYRDIYETEGGDRLSAELIFIEGSGDLLTVCVYIYREPNHAGEILTVLRLLDAG